MIPHFDACFLTYYAGKFIVPDVMENHQLKYLAIWGDLGAYSEQNIS